MRRFLVRAGLALAVFVVAVVVWNLPFWAPPAADAAPRLIAHRGVHHTFDRAGLEGDTCTAERIHPPEHQLFENTIASMSAAFAAGADVVELDIHPTTDGHLAVFHDWTVDCRTEGSGETRAHDLAYLRSLDIGWGYTADGGLTFPLRGLGTGLMPTLDEVLAAFPEGRFLVNFKSNEAREADMLAALLDAEPGWREAVWGVYGGDPPTVRSAGLIPGLATTSRRATVDCLTQYLAIGWTGIVPASCRDALVMVPANYAFLLWGWPGLFERRMHEAGSEIVLLGPFEAGDPGSAGIDSLDQLDLIPEGFGGYVWTNRIELIGPALGR